MRETIGSIVVISNHWHQPAVKVTVRYHELEAPAGSIFMEIPLDDVIRGIEAELPTPWQARIWNRERLVSEYQAAVTRAMEKIKGASSAAMAQIPSVMKEAE